MFKGSENCKDESQLRDWRQRVASHIRANMPQRFQIPALGDMQMRFENRLDVLHRAEANAKAAAEGKDVDAIVKLNADANTSENASHATSWMLVLAGLALPAVIAFAKAILQSSRKSSSPCVNGLSS